MSCGEEQELLVGTLYRISKTSNGLALWIPAKVVEKLGFKPGEKVVLIPREDRVELIPFSRVLGKVVIYARVSSADQKEDLERQKLAPQAPDGCGVFVRSPRKPSHDMRREGMKVNTRPEREMRVEREVGLAVGR
jgi:bifunctional DNA-binding transcriptional regulator/antitoxin component of YhaV-PrlF toxin-antitoxin module